MTPEGGVTERNMGCPASSVEALDVRLLSPNALLVLRVACRIGSEFSYNELMLAISSDRSIELGAPLAELVDRGWIRYKDPWGFSTEYEFINGSYEVARRYFYMRGMASFSG